MSITRRTFLIVVVALALCGVASAQMGANLCPPASADCVAVRHVLAGCGSGGIGPEFDWIYDNPPINPYNTKPQRQPRQHQPHRVAPRRSFVRVGALDVGLAIARAIKR